MSEQITLRRLSDQDAPGIFSLVERNRPELSKFWWEQTTQTPLDSLRFIRAMQDLEQTNGAPARGIVTSDMLVGIVALHRIDWESRRAALGYWVDRAQAGRGIATQAVRSMVAMADETLRLHEVTVSAEVANHASRAVAEKCGFELIDINAHAPWRSDGATSAPVAHYRLKVGSLVEAA